MILAHDTKQNERFREMGRDLFFFCKDIEKIKEYISKYTAIDKIANWGRMSMSTAQGAVTLDGGYAEVCFDGRYIYYTPRGADTFLRFDTTLSFTNSNAWGRMSASTAQGGSTLDRAYYGSCFDGRYIYYCPSHSYTFLRFDTTQSFTNSNAWEKMSVSTVKGYSNYNDYYICSGKFDGRYIYFGSWTTGVNTFLRFDTTQSFTNSSAWEKMNLSTIYGNSATHQSNTVEFDGRYIYYSSQQDTYIFLRFDTTLSFTNSSAWEKMNMSTAQGGSTGTYFGNCFDGRYIYYSPYASYTFLRFDTTQPFTNSSAWERMSASTAQGGSTGTYFGNCFDGRYIYYCSRDSNTFLRFDTTQSFTNSSAWEKMNMSTVQGGSDFNVPNYIGSTFDGKYIYFSAFNADTFLRVLACPNKSLRNQM